MIFFLVAILSFPKCQSAILRAPQIGTKYSAHLNFLVGSQDITLLILSKKKAEISLKGLLNIEDNLQYSLEKDGHFSFTLSTSLKNYLDKFRCTIADAQYDNGVATIRILIKPLRFHKRVKLYPHYPLHPMRTVCGLVN